MNEIVVRPIGVLTCEGRAAGEEPFFVWPGNGEAVTLFSLHDPFGIRKAVVPLFRMDADGVLEGLGTAFSVDPWGGFMTADHVVADGRCWGHTTRQADGNWQTTMPANAGLVALLGYGWVWARAPLPPDAIVPILSAWSPAMDRENPLSWTQTFDDCQPMDLSVLRTQRPPRGAVKNLPIRSRAPHPKVGDFVVALGFPQLDTFVGGIDVAKTVISEGMKAAYGLVTRLLPEGQSISNPTPVFEVEANWPGGMSGGPVLNTEGEVVGLVSRSIAAAAHGEIGTGWATWLGAFSALPDWAPTLDPDNRDWRRGWCVVRDRPWHLAGIFASREEAEACCAGLDGAYRIVLGSNHLGTDGVMWSDAGRDRRIQVISD